MGRLKECRTLVRFFVQRSKYEAGKGVKTKWQPIEGKIGTDEYTGKSIMTDCFYVEWAGSYGAVAIRQQADGVVRPARIRMPYVKTVYDALVGEDVRIYKNGVIDDAHLYKLCSAADDYMDGHKFIEFQVEKYEVR